MDLILHHYPQSPVSEKVRVVLGFKDLDWRSVTIPRLPPKPDLVALTGGYRMTPVMQVGADVFCDTQCILREIERLKPEPTLFPGGADGMAWVLAQATDGPLFKTVVAVVFGDSIDAMGDDFKADRGLLYFGPDADFEAMARAIPANLAQLRTRFRSMDDRLEDRDFLLGDAPGLPDAICYYLVWFLRGRYSKGPDFLAQFENLVQWEQRVQAFGHGRPTDMDAAESLAVARDSTPRAPTAGDDPLDPMGLEAGEVVRVGPAGTDGCPAVTGRITEVGVHEIAILREDGDLGDVVVHFPRAGYAVERV